VKKNAVQPCFLQLSARAAKLPARAFLVLLVIGWQKAALPRVGQPRVGLIYVAGTLWPLPVKPEDTLGNDKALRECA
jgi:hypothetical protein